MSTVAVIKWSIVKATLTMWRPLIIGFLNHLIVIAIISNTFVIIDSNENSNGTIIMYQSWLKKITVIDIEIKRMIASAKERNKVTRPRVRNRQIDLNQFCVISNFWWVMFCTMFIGGRFLIGESFLKVF